MKISTGIGTYLDPKVGSGLADLTRNVDVDENTGVGTIHFRWEGYEATLTVHAVSTDA